MDSDSQIWFKFGIRTLNRIQKPVNLYRDAAPDPLPCKKGPTRIGSETANYTPSELNIAQNVLNSIFQGFQ